MAKKKDYVPKVTPNEPSKDKENFPMSTSHEMREDVKKTKSKKKSVDVHKLAEVTLGSGAAEKARKTLRDRKKKIDSVTG